MSIESHLDAILKVVPRPEALAHNAYSFVKTYGRSFERQPLPRQYKRGTPQRCFSNSLNRVRAHTNLIYVEGFALVSGVPLEHAWCISEEEPDKVLEFTSPLFDEYFGVPFQRKYILTHSRRCNGISILHDWQNDFPAFQHSFDPAIAIYGFKSPCETT